MTEEGHEDQFPPRRLSACCGFGQETFAGGAGNGQDAPISALRLLDSQRGSAPANPLNLG